MTDVVRWGVHALPLLSSSPFHAYAVATRWGPHVTLQAGVVHLGRHWTTTTRRSVKVRSVQRLRLASVTVQDHGRHRVLGGPARVLDPTRPWTFVTSPVAGALAGGAVVRLAAEQLEQVLGYAEAGNRVPDAFKPWGRVLLVTDLCDSLSLEGDRVVAADGRWARPPGPLGPPRRSRTAWPGVSTATALPPDVAGLAQEDADCWLGVGTSSGAVALPARWDFTRGRVRVSADALAMVGPVLPGPICVTLDESSQRRPDLKLGAMLRGRAQLVGLDDQGATLDLRLERVTYWRGFDTATVAALR